ncbi:addiction module toxin RelE [Pelagibius litoralis]|uniref:Addiction module toxin RelE n=1 Tax=Pelagibius litoralis TaxID=374515 RepID=A0A967EY13_9PROT|nr:transposase [Pelagibius litoralis]NIA69521.1 addiction module toxin RelE [Pelagibius litoralis]
MTYLDYALAMARPLRLERPGAVYHISTLGNAGQAVFRGPDDSQLFLDVLGEACRRFHWRCLAYCLLPDRYTLVVVTDAATLSRGMRQINGPYTQAFHRRHGSAGHLFQGRYRAVMVEQAGYLAFVCCDVLRQPVRRGVAPEAGAWRWSSYRATMGRLTHGQMAPDWLDSGPLLAAYGTDRQQARAQLAAAVAQEPSQSVWEHLRHQVFLGSEGFVEAMREEARLAAAGRGDLREIPRAQWQPPPPALESFAQGAASRDEAMALAYLSGAYSQAAIASYFGVHYSSVSRAIRRYERRQPMAATGANAGE